MKFILAMYTEEKSRNKKRVNDLNKFLSNLTESGEFIPLHFCEFLVEFILVFALISLHLPTEHAITGSDPREYSGVSGKVQIFRIKYTM